MYNYSIKQFNVDKDFYYMDDWFKELYVALWSIVYVYCLIDEWSESTSVL